MPDIFSSYTVAIGPSLVMGAFIGVTDLLLKPGMKNGLESFLMYTVQAFTLYMVFQVQSKNSPLCNIGPTRGGEVDMGKALMKTVLGTGVLWFTDLILRPAHVENLWMQFIKFLIQGSVIWHIYNHQFMDSTDSSAPPTGTAPRYGY